MGKFAGAGFESIDYLRWIYQYAFCSTSTTIVSGSLAERTYTDVYLVFSMIIILSKSKF